MDSLYSKHLENAVNEISKLPGIGKRSALRLALHLVKQDEASVSLLTDRINKLKSSLMYCRVCHNISDTEVCDICSNPKRNGRLICVVQDIRDVIAIENTGQYNGLYHVLGGVISPVEGIGIQQLTIRQLFDRVEAGNIDEVILALPATVEGDTTNFFIYKNIKDKVPSVTTIARGIGVGEELEYADEITLGRSILSRTNFDNSLKTR
ncbi:MAG: recombination mediator RecR [Bacteroidales bacterium]|nr:recombination mediator RecR [Bacteroidales bacterium]